MAKLYKKEGNKLYISDELGDIWLIADYSFNVNELETIHPKRADEDMEGVHNFMNDLRKNPTTFSEVLEVTNGIQQNQLVFDRNMASHLNVLGKLGEAVEELTKSVKELKK